VCPVVTSRKTAVIFMKLCRTSFTPEPAVCSITQLIRSK
jgi:hypothetical protein